MNQWGGRVLLAVAASTAVLGAVLVAGGRPAAAQTGQATATPTTAPTPAATAVRLPTATPTPAVAPTPTVTVELLPPPPPAQDILPAPSVKNRLVGDVVSQNGVPLSTNYPTLFGDRIALGMANLHDVTAGEQAGDGIESVEFTILDLTGKSVFHSRTGRYDRFCAFGGAGEECAVHDFAAHGYRWPGGTPVVSGRYTLVAFARGVEESHKGAWTLSFEVRLSRDGQQESDGEAFIRSVKRTGPTTFSVTVETLGFVPFARSTHLVFYSAALRDVEAIAGAAGVFLVYPSYDEMDVPGAYGMAQVTVDVGSGQYRRTTALCVAVANPDGSIIPGRGECARLP